jgi:hypothetical protein
MHTCLHATAASTAALSCLHFWLLHCRPASVNTCYISMSAWSNTSARRLHHRNAYWYIACTRSNANDCPALEATYRGIVNEWKSTVPAATGVTNFNVVSTSNLYTQVLGPCVHVIRQHQLQCIRGHLGRVCVIVDIRPAVAFCANEALSWGVSEGQR